MQFAGRTYEICRHWEHDAVKGAKGVGNGSENDMVSLAHYFLFNTAPDARPAAAASVCRTALRQRQRRVLKPAWGNAPGNASQPQQGLKARLIPPPCAIHHPVTNDVARMNRAVDAQGLCVPMTWAFGPGRYEPGLWPIIFAMPQIRLMGRIP